MDNYFDLDLHTESSSSIAGRLVLWAMLGVFALASAVTTFSFFATFAPGLGRVIHPTLAPYISGALGVALFDAAGLGWTVLRARNSDTGRQFVIATAAAIVTIALSLITSALQVMLASSFDVGLYTAAGELTQFGSSMQLAGVSVMTLGFVLNFGAIAAYVNTGAGVTEAVQQTQLRAYATAGRFAADRARAELVTRQTLAGILEQLPNLAAMDGQRQAGGYLDHKFAGAKAAPPPLPEDAPPGAQVIPLQLQGKPGWGIAFEPLSGEETEQGAGAVAEMDQQLRRARRNGKGEDTPFPGRS